MIPKNKFVERRAISCEPDEKFYGTHIVDHVLLCVGTGPVEGGQQRLQVLSAVVLGM